MTFLFGSILKYKLKNAGFPNGIDSLRNSLGEEEFSIQDWNNLKPSPEEKIDPSYFGPPPTIWYVLYTQRPDGTPQSELNQKGLTDVYCSTSIYSYQIDGSMGSEIILRSNGVIEAVPEDEVFFCPQSKHGLAFPSQSHVPPLFTLSFSETQSGPLIFTKPIGRADQLVEDNGGPESLIHLSRRESYPTPYGIDRESLWQIFDPSKPEFALTDIQVGAAKLGLNTQAEKQTLTQLQKSGTPALMFLKDDGRIVTLTAIDDDRAVVIDRGLTQNIERSVLEKRYSGEALVPTKALTQNAAIVADDAVRELKLPSLDAEVPQQFVLRNTGTTPITLQLEYPLLGVTESRLSRDVIPPGETATLDLKVKWRSILKAPHQNVLVSIQTNDPIVPRLQLAVLLTPPQGAGK